ncbi:MAG: nucleotide-binding protein [Planctomycetota bacterium]
MYNLIVSGQFDERPADTFSFPGSRFLEYTSSAISSELTPFSVEAAEIITSWPCLLMTEGRGEERAFIASMNRIDDGGYEIEAKVSLIDTNPEILNADIWKLRSELDIDQFEFHRNHWAVKERDLLGALYTASFVTTKPWLGHENIGLPIRPSRQEILMSRDKLADWSHAQIDDLLLEIGVKEVESDRSSGSVRDRANHIVRFVLSNPGALTIDKHLVSSLLVNRTRQDSKGSAQETLSRRQIPSQSEHRDRSSNRVFVVHGRNEQARNSVVKFLRELGLQPVVLHEQANMGRHLLTKFIDEAELVTFAVVVMTGDDIGGVKDQESNPRARQNVILELGYFLSHLGQERVCALKSPGLETPSDFDGIVYISMAEEEVWKEELLRELKAAKMPVVIS